MNSAQAFCHYIPFITKRQYTNHSPHIILNKNKRNIVENVNKYY